MLAQAEAWAPHLSHEGVAFSDGDATAAKLEGGAPHRPAACVRVPRDGLGGFALAVEVEQLPELIGTLSFGIGRAKAKEGDFMSIFSHAEGTCGLAQHADGGGSARSKNFGRRADSGGNRLEPAIRAGSRLALHLSARGTERARTARFFVDGSECAVFADIEDDGESSDWVAGITLTSGARVRLVSADGVELWSEMERAEATLARQRETLAAKDTEIARLRRIIADLVKTVGDAEKPEVAAALAAVTAEEGEPPGGWLVAVGEGWA